MGLWFFVFAFHVRVVSALRAIALGTEDSEPGDGSGKARTPGCPSDEVNNRIPHQRLPAFEEEVPRSRGVFYVIIPYPGQFQ